MILYQLFMSVAYKDIEQLNNSIPLTLKKDPLLNQIKLTNKLTFDNIQQIHEVYQFYG